MDEHAGSKLNEPRKYFSTLYYKNQESRQELPTHNEQAMLKNLKTDYEGMRYQIPEEMKVILNTHHKYQEIDRFYESKLGSNHDIRWNRELTLETKENDYDYRFWLQYEVENMSSGNRSMRLLLEKNNEYEIAMAKLSQLSMKLSVFLLEMCKDMARQDRASDSNPLSHLITINNEVKNDVIFYSKIEQRFFAFEASHSNNKLKQHIRDLPLFYHFSKEALIVFLKTMRVSTKLRFFQNKEEIEDSLASLDFHDTEHKTNRELIQVLRSLLNDVQHKDRKADYFETRLVCETNSVFRKLYVKMGQTLNIWARYFLKVPGVKKSNKFFDTLAIVTQDNNINPSDDQDLEIQDKAFRSICVKLATGALFSAFNCNFVNFDSASVDELDALYSQDYEHTGTSYPNVIRMTKELSQELKFGDHPIIRHFQMDIKRNMYCLPQPHIAFERGKRGTGGFLHHDNMSISLHPALLNLINAKRLNHSRIEPSANALNALNILQKTQWSINLDFLDFVSVLTLDGEKISPYPIDIRQSAWQRSDNLELREIFIEKMNLRAEEATIKSHFRTIKANLRQARKNMYNSGNVFWHPWFCDWRGRFNTKINELSPQGDDLSKALLLFTEWKPLGIIGRDWLYVRAYDLMAKILSPGDKKIDCFEEQREWVSSHLDRILTIGKKLNRYTKESELSDLLDLLQVKKPGPKSEIFQRISFLIEFSRIHREFQAKQKNWDLVKSGLPIHLDASCNGFQHIAALTRNEKLAKSVNLLKNPGNQKGDLYEEVAQQARRGLMNQSNESEGLRVIIDQICQNEKSKMNLIEGIITRDFCKPLVMVTAYGAKDLASQIMNLNGKKNRRGRYKPIKGEKSLPTAHLESLLYLAISEIQQEHGGLEKIIIAKNSSGYLSPVKNCELLKSFGIQLSNYIKDCIGIVTDFEFEEIKEKLGEIYDKIDVGINDLPADISGLHKLSSDNLSDILLQLNLPQSGKKSEKLTTLRNFFIEKRKNKLYFTWRVDEDASLVRCIKWKLDHNRTQATLATKILPKSYVDPGEDAIEQFLLNSPTLSEKLKSRLLDERKKVHKNRLEGKSNKQSSDARKLKNLVLMCLRNIAILSKDIEEGKVAKNHLYARFIELKQKRTADGKSNGHRFSIDTGNDMKFNASTKQGFDQSIKKLNDLSDEIKLGMVPNFIHSFDALHMQKVIIALHDQGISDIWAVHDSFGVHPCHVEQLRNIVNETFVHLHRESFESHLSRIIKLNLPLLEQEFSVEDFFKSVKKQTDYDWINDVLEAKFLIS